MRFLRDNLGIDPKDGRTGLSRKYLDFTGILSDNTRYVGVLLFLLDDKYRMEQKGEFNSQLKLIGFS